MTENSVKACQGCGGPVGKDNKRGYCNVNAACKREAARLAAIDYRANKPGAHPGRGRGARYHGMPQEAEMVYNARRRARELGIECTITVHDVIIPARCPILGIPLVRGEGKQAASSPSIDRIRNDEGYVPGNIQVVSYRANRMKSDASDAELKLFADWIYLHLEVSLGG